MRRNGAIMLFLILLMVILTGCEKSAIKIGYAGGLTGTNSELGVSGMYGAQLAVDVINASGGIDGRRLELIVKDDMDDKETALQADKLLANEGCIAIIGHMTSSMAELTVPYINEEKLLMISPTIATSSMSRIDDYFLRLIPSTEEQARRIAMEIKKLDLSDVLLFYTNGNISFAESLSKYLVEELGDSDIRIEMMEAIKIKEHEDYRKVAETLGNSKAEGLVIIASADVVSNLGQELYLLKKEKVVFLPAWAMTNDLLRRGGHAVENYYGVSFIDYGSEEEAYLDFKNKYLEKYGDNPTFSSILSYESVMVLAEAIKASPGHGSDELKTAILEQSSYQGLQSKITIDRFGDTEREIFLYQIRSNEFKKVE